MTSDIKFGELDIGTMFTDVVTKQNTYEKTGVGTAVCRDFNTDDDEFMHAADADGILGPVYGHVFTIGEGTLVRFSL